jgi:hypothetical protein
VSHGGSKFASVGETLLSTEDVATFVARGFLEFPGVIPDELNAAAADEMRAIMATWGSPARPFAPASGDAWRAVYPEPSAIGAVLRHRAVRRIVDSLVGPEAVFDHDFVHFKPAGDRTFQPLHADAVIDPNTAFDIQVFYFPNEVHPGGGGTGFVPGTHLRRVHETQVGRYRHIRGERQWSGPAGSILVFHHGLWHRGMGNPSTVDRLMYKIRLNPTRPQVRRWDASDLPGRQSAPNDHIFATFDTERIGMTLRHREAWMGEQDHRLELIARAGLWRYLTGDEAFDLDWYRTRVVGRAALTGAEG